MTDTIRYLVLEMGGGRCVLCGRSVADVVKLEVDHFIPCSKEGKTEISNLRVLCEQCNRGKSDIVPFARTNC